VTSAAGGSARARAVEQAEALMRAFALRTGLTGEAPPRRYLWTDAFAVCNYLALWRATGRDRPRALARELVDQVHRVLGRHRPDDSRRGWISGLSEEEGARHPTRGGLRIGKPLPERLPGQLPDERLEWERDGQYFHYLTRWMHALAQLARWTGEERALTWARELAVTAHRAFVRGSAGARHMVWKLSIDLSRPLVASTGQHDPLDGLVTGLELGASASGGAGPAEPELAGALADYAELAAAGRWETADPLGLGGLLMDAGVVAQLMARGDVRDGGLLAALLEAARAGLVHYLSRDELRQPLARRLAFRELGLAIGLAALDPIRHALGRLPAESREEVRGPLSALAAHAGLGGSIAAGWLEPGARGGPGWLDHADINDVMLASALVPEGALRLAPAPEAGGWAG
jgi:hypothetical protein